MNASGVTQDPQDEQPQEHGAWQKCQATAEETTLLARAVPIDNLPVVISVSGKTAQLKREHHNQPLVFSTKTHKAKYNKKSCFVQVADEAFGEIEYFLSHHDETFAMLNVFPPPEIDQDTHMYYCKRETACRNLMRLSSLGKPLFTALQGDVIYFLSVPIRESPEWLNSHIACH